MSPNDRRTLIIVGSVLLALVLVWFLFLRGGGSDTAVPTPTTGVSTVVNPASTTPPLPAGAQNGTLPLPGRDPFSPLPSPSPSVSPTPSPTPSAGP